MANTEDEPEVTDLSTVNNMDLNGGSEWSTVDIMMAAVCAPQDTGAQHTTNDTCKEQYIFDNLQVQVQHPSSEETQLKSPFTPVTTLLPVQDPIGVPVPCGPPGIHLPPQTQVTSSPVNISNCGAVGIGTTHISVTQHFGSTSPPTPACTPSPTRSFAFLSPEEAADKCQRHLQRLYSQYNKTCPLPWYQVNQLSTKDSYIPVQFEERSLQQGTRATCIQEDDLPFGEEQFIRIDGVGGIGKSMYMHRLATSWANGTSKKLSKIKLLFLIEANRLPANTTCILDTIFDQLMPDTDIQKEVLKEWMKENPKLVMFLIDNFEQNVGFKEESYMAKFLKGHCFPGSNIVISVRTGFVKRRSFLHRSTSHVYKLYSMAGFSTEDVNLYIDKFFSVDQKQSDDDRAGNETMREKASELKEILKGDSNLRELVKNRLHAALICTLHAKNEMPMTLSLTGVYNQFVDLLFRWCFDSERNLSFGEDLTSRDLYCEWKEAIMSCLAELAWAGIDSDQITFSQDRVVEICGSGSVLQDILWMGLLLCNTDQHGDEMLYTFPHQLLQQFLASHYVVDHPPMYPICWTKWCDTKKYEMVCIFVAGLASAEKCGNFFEVFENCHQVMLEEGKKGDCSPCCIDNCALLACCCLGEVSRPLDFADKEAKCLSCQKEICVRIFHRDGDYFKSHTLGALAMVISALSKEIEKRGTNMNLTALRLVKFDARDQLGVTKLAEAIRSARFLQTLEVSLTGMDCMGTDSAAVLQILKAIRESESVQELILEAHIDAMSEQVVMAQMSSILHKTKGKRNDTCLEEAKTEEFVVKLANALKSSKVTQLYLPDNLLTGFALPHMAKALTCHPTLKHLSVSGYFNGTDAIDGISLEALTKLIENNPQLEAFCLSSMALAHTLMATPIEEMGPFAEALSKAPNLSTLKLNLRWMFPGTMRLFAGAIGSSSLTNVELSWHKMTGTFLSLLAGYLMSSKTLSTLHLNGAFQAGKGLRAFILAAASSPVLSSLTLTGNPFHTEVLKAIAETVSNWSLSDFTKPAITLILGGRIDNSVEEASQWYNVTTTDELDMKKRMRHDEIQSAINAVCQVQGPLMKQGSKYCVWVTSEFHEGDYTFTTVIHVDGSLQLQMVEDHFAL
ncbi:hypothetical protein Bbelb_368920 [Branchiostoma belcheri]|nr:hypothetical protein Bbelb_368920 [Branchiostoma belcheri]